MSKDYNQGEQAEAGDGSVEERLAAYKERMQQQNGSGNASGGNDEPETPALLGRVRDDQDAAKIAGTPDEEDPELDYKLSVYRYEEQDENAFQGVDYTRRGERPRPAKRGRGLGDYLAIAAIVLIPALIALTLILTAVNNRNQDLARVQQAVQPTTIVPYADKLPIVGLNPRTNSDGSVDVTVQVNNSGTRTVESLIVTVIVKDARNAPVGTGVAAIRNLAPGGLGEGTTHIIPSAAYVGAPSAFVSSTSLSSAP